MVSAFNIPINDDDLIDSNEMFNIAIEQSSLPDDCTVSAFGSATVEIIDDDGKWQLHIFRHIHAILL